MAETNGNGVRVTNREIFDEVKELRKEVAGLRELLGGHASRVDGLATQVKLLWTLSFALVGTIATAAVKVFGS